MRPRLFLSFFTMNTESNLNWSSVGPGIAIGAGTSAAGGLLGQVFGGWNARRQWKYQRRAMELQQKYALEQMKEQSRLQREQFDYENEYNSPVNTFARYRAAGINPAAVLGSSGASMSATMPMPSGPAGSSVSPGPGVSPAPDMSGSVSNGALVSSQIDYNKAAAENQRSGAALQESKIPTEAALREFYAAGADKASNDANLAELQANYQSMVNARTPEQIQSAISNIVAQTDKLIAARDVDVEQTRYLRECAAEMIVKADLERAMTGRESALTKRIGKETYYIGLQAKDLDKTIQSYDGHSCEVPVFTRDEDGNEKMTMVKLNGYEAKAVVQEYAALKGIHDYTVSFVEADWANPDKWNQTILGYTDRGIKIGETCGGFIFKGLLRRDFRERFNDIRVPYRDPRAGIEPDYNF